MPAWTLSLNGAPRVTVASLGLADPLIRLRSLAASTLTLTAAGAEYDSAPIFAFGDLVQLFNPGGTKVFEGRCRMNSPEAEAKRTDIFYTIYDAWDQLEKRAFLQTWYRVTNASVVYDPDTNPLVGIGMGQGILGQASTGAQCNVAQSVNEILADNIAAQVNVNNINPQTAADFQFTPLDFTDGYPGNPWAINFPYDEFNAITGAEALKRVFKYAPDACSWFDYSTSPPTLYFARMTGANTGTNPVASATIQNPPKNYDPNQAATYNPQAVSAVKIKPRYDLQVPAVAFGFITDNRYNGLSQWDVLPYQTPNDYAGRDYNALIAFIKLAGSAQSSKQTVLKAEISVLGLTVPGTGILLGAWTPGAMTTGQLAWLQAKIPNLQARIAAGAIGSSGANIPQVNGIQIYHADGTALADPNTTTDAMPYELLSGPIPAWLKANYSITEEVRTVVIQLTIYNTVAATKCWYNFEVSFTYHATSCSGANFRFLESDRESYTPPETVPTLLPFYFYNMLSGLQFQGKIKLGPAPEVTNAYRPGLLLNVTNGLTAWATMNGVVQEVFYDVEKGSTEITFGPPEHISPQALVDLMRHLAAKRIPETYSWRANGSTAGGTGEQDIEAGARHVPNGGGTLPDVDPSASPPGGAGIGGSATPLVFSKRPVLVWDDVSETVKTMLLDGSQAY